MKVLFVPYGTDKAPATRFRVTQYLPYLEKKRVKYRVFSAISKISTDQMLKSPDFGKAKKLFYYIYIYIDRLVRAVYIMFIANGFDIIYLQRTTFPIRLEAVLKILNDRIIFDIDDAIYLPDKEGDASYQLKKYIKEREVINALKISKACIVENEYIKDFVSRYCGNILKIPGPIDTERFFVKNKKPSKEVVIGWTGSPATTSYLHMLDSVLRRIKEKYSFIKFRFVGLGRYENSNVDVAKVGWRYDTEVEELQNFDIGIMPMPNDKWTKGKLGCKMLQYMAVGIPSVVSYTATNAEIIEDGSNGFFARDDDEWIDKLSILIEDRSLRNLMGSRGRDTVVEKCGITHNIDKYIDLFTKAAG